MAKKRSGKERKSKGGRRRTIDKDSPDTRDIIRDTVKPKPSQDTPHKKIKKLARPEVNERNGLVGAPQLKDHQFSEGNTRAKNNRRPDPFSKKAAKKFVEADFKDILDVLIEQDMDTLKEIGDTKQAGEDAPKHSVIKVMAARVALRIIATGSAKDFETFLNRIIGKPKTYVQISGDPEAPVMPTLPTGAKVTIVIPSNGKEVPHDA